ncbi:DinB family protein [uncultured Eudoraea sp.]|uniref:DinB family protein n=1 Tax=uncultured Eudoraea sp. TaxID=1035614 RepID=UPI00260E7516|nr:DinB family protein [uncultured Eudoraea sp.]
MKNSELKKEDYNPYYEPYIAALGDVQLLDMLKRQLVNFPQFIDSIPEDKFHYSYQEGKWTVAQVLLHILDTERVFQYRALRFARKDKTPLPGFDQDKFVMESNAENWTKQEMIDNYIIIRKSTIALFEKLPEEALARVGIASDSPMSVAALGFICCGHQKHHRNIIRERYL